MIRIPIALLALAVLPPPAAALDLGAVDAEAQQVVAAGFAAPLAESRAAGAQDAIFTGRADLNGDGRAEIIGMVMSGFLCGGGGGCPIGIFRAEPDGSFSYVTSVRGDFIDVLERSTKGWRDLRLASQIGEVTVVWNGNDYTVP